MMTIVSSPMSSILGIMGSDGLIAGLLLRLAREFWFTLVSPLDCKNSMNPGWAHYFYYSTLGVKMQE